MDRTEIDGQDMAILVLAYKRRFRVVFKPHLCKDGESVASGENV